MQTRLILLRGVIGAGKTTLAKTIAPDSEICCADDFFTDGNGNYNFNPSQLGAAHKYCQEKFLKLCDDPSTHTIVVANTNTKESDFNFYLKEAQKRNMMIFSLVLENRHGGQNVHSVPEEVLLRQEQNIKNTLKLR